MSDAPDATLLFLHGLGAEGGDLAPLIPMLGFSATDRLRVVLPNAPIRPVTINGGMSMRAWYDMQAIAPRRQVNRDHIATSVETIEGLLRREEAAGVPASRILLAGFSQGGAIALLAGLGHARPLAGVVALSCYLPDLGTPPKRDPANAATPFWHAHGSEDEMVPMALGQAACDAVRAGGNPTSWQAYPMGHEVCAEQLNELGRWMRTRLNAQPEVDDG